MQQARWSTTVRVGVLAASLLVLPLTMPPFAQVRIDDPRSHYPGGTKCATTTDTRGRGACSVWRAWRARLGGGGTLSRRLLYRTTPRL